MKHLDLKTLKVIFVLFNLHVKNKNVNSFSIKEIMEGTKLYDYAVNKVLNNIDVVFDRENITNHVLRNIHYHI